MKAKPTWFLAFVITGVSAGAWARQAPPAPQASSDSTGNSSGATGKIKCPGESSVTITSDAEQALPLRTVATAACGEIVTVLSDLQGYTVKVRTADGKIGYVTRYEIGVDSSLKEPTPAAPPAVVTDANSNQMQGQQAKPLEPVTAPDEKSSGKPRVYITDTESWTEIGGFTGTGYAAGYNPDMVEIYQDFTSDCPVVAVTQEKSKADYAVLFDKGTSKKGFTGFGGLVKVNKVTVVTRSGETLLSQALHSEDAAVKLACDAVGQRQATTGASQPSKTIQ